MRYTNQICDLCGKIFSEDDDIVVCPDCATPQHRECYNKNGGCINSHRHDGNFTWEPLGKALPLTPVKDEPTKTVPCPNCGYNNPEGSDHCKQCSMKFTLFGFNVVDASARADEKETNNIPEYEPPFTLGEGDGFSENENDGAPPDVSRDEIEQKLIDVISASSGFSPDGEGSSFGGPFPKDDKTCGVHTNLLGAFIGVNAVKYIGKFRKRDEGKKLSFNFAAFFFSPYWFFYRKLIKPGIIFMTANFCLSIISTPYLLEFTEKASPLLEQLYSVTTEAAAAQIMAELEPLYLPIIIISALQLLLNLVAGLSADSLYRKYTITCIKEMEAFPDQKLSMAHLLKKGSVAPLYALIAVLAENILSSLIGMIM